MSSHHSRLIVGLVAGAVSLGAFYVQKKRKVQDKEKQKDKEAENERGKTREIGVFKCTDDLDRGKATKIALAVSTYKPLFSCVSLSPENLVAALETQNALVFIHSSSNNNDDDNDDEPLRLPSHLSIKCSCVVLLMESKEKGRAFGEKLLSLSLDSDSDSNSKGNQVCVILGNNGNDASLLERERYFAHFEWIFLDQLFTKGVPRLGKLVVSANVAEKAFDKIQRHCDYFSLLSIDYKYN